MEPTKTEAFYRQRAAESISQKKYDHYTALAEEAARRERKCQWCRECDIAARCTRVTIYGPLSAERVRSDYVCRDCGCTWEDDTPIDRSPPSCLAGPVVRSVLGGAA